jgi:hypothetical protein
MDCVTNDAWLSESEQRAWRGFIRLQNEVRAQVSRRLQQETGLSGADYDVLSHTGVDVMRVRDGGVSESLPYVKR